ncbi:hypothetical protein HSB1_21440 [Halogranum salarium B-1]|uniref:Uncharacterized protein n=1 Tax=Halogranum salarium B-1 TaxID=1210908 RepID=J3JGC8_9EURY|nr:hypothetical protein HSB1_21440 [Halogranum salarium B-1]
MLERVDPAHDKVLPDRLHSLELRLGDIRDRLAVTGSRRHVDGPRVGYGVIDPREELDTAVRCDD